jgi:hypothetical protein
MAKASSTTDVIVKLQIPVTRELADELARWARKMEVTQANLCKALLSFAMDDVPNVGEWLKIRAIGKRPKWIKAGWLQQGENLGARLQVPVASDLADRIEALASRLNQSPMKLSALLLDFSLADEKWSMRFLATRVGREFMALFGKKPQAFELAEMEMQGSD